VDTRGIIRVGPRSAGSNPGPACFGRGGVEPTLTDACVVLGLLDPDHFLGGSQKLDADAARSAVRANLVEPLGLPDVSQAAAAMYQLALADMANNVRRMSIEKGYDPREFSLLCYGGAGGLFLAAVCALASVPEMIVPQNCAVFSALGALLSDYRRTALRSCPWRLGGDPRVIAAALDALEVKVMQNIRDAGLSESSIRLERSADMRFVGQSSEISVPLPEGPIEKGFASALRTNFRTEYARAFGAAAFWADAEPEIVNLRVTAVAPTAVEMRPSTARAESIRPTGMRKVFWPFDMASSDWSVRDRAGISPGSTLAGPLIVESSDTTIVIPTGCTARADGSGNLIIRISEQGLAASHGDAAERENAYGS
jgi:N-methylhydantoinase A